MWKLKSKVGGNLLFTENRLLKSARFNFDFHIQFLQKFDNEHIIKHYLHFNSMESVNMSGKCWKDWVKHYYNACERTGSKHYYNTCERTGSKHYYNACERTGSNKLKKERCALPNEKRNKSLPPELLRNFQDS